ncbi:MAG: hypothetical protein ACREE0_01810 [Phenylobacterium sp.]
MAGRTAPLGGAAIGIMLACSPDVSDAQTRRRQPATPSAVEQKVDSLSRTVEALDARLAEETRARQAMEAQLRDAKADAAASRAEARSARAELDAQIKTIPGVADAAIERQAQTGPGFRFRGITITPGGFLAAEGIYRSKNLASDISSNFTRIPFDNSPLAHMDETRLTARQTRLSLLAQGDINEHTRAAFYGEFDFQAAAQTANSNESNSFNPRIRHLYGTIDWNDSGWHLLAGQNWSLVTLNTKGITPRNEAPPPQIDGQYIPGFVWARQAQLRLVKDFNGLVWGAVSLENPQTTFAATATGISSVASGITVLSVTPGATGFDSANSLSLNHLPDVVGKVVFEPTIGGKRPLHLEAFGLWRSYEVRVNAAPGNALGLTPGAFTAQGQGGGFGGSVMWTAIPGRLDLQGSVLSGSGVGRYGSTQLPDVTLKPDGDVAPIKETMYLVGATWHATPALDFYLFGGEERQKSKFYDNAAGHFGYGNPAATFTETGCTTEGGTCSPNIRKVSQITVGAWQKAFTGSYGQIRLGLQYSHTRLTGFSGRDGFVPKTSDDMVFTSFRYYLPTP